VSGEKGRVVGYGAVALYRTGAEPAGPAPDSTKQKEKATMTQDKARPPAEEELSAAQRAEVLRMARLSLESHVRDGKAPSITVDDPALKRPCGAFVTLKKKGELRGCIGSLQAAEPLADTIIEMAGAAALRDPRFDPVRPEELADIDLEVSVLTPMRLISDVNEIEVGRHGLYIVHGFYRGVLLPQVAPEQGWNRDEFLRHTCLKAGLPPDDWQKGAKIYVFTAQVFGEKEIGKSGN
jgi:AmmeMemoRadiSam system protein A